MRKCIFVALLLGAALAAWTGSAYAAHLPTHGDVVHLDLNPGATYDTLLPWPGIPAAPNPVVGGNPPTFAGSFEGGEFVQFTDALQSLQLHMWENEIQNLSSIRRTFKLLIQDRDPGVLNRWFYVTLDPGWSIVIDLHVDEGVADTGAFTWLAASLLKYRIGVDASVTENRLLQPHPFPFPCGVNTDGCLAVYFVDPAGNVLPPNLATGGSYVQRQFSGCPDVFLLKTNSRIRVPWFAKLRCVNGVFVLVVNERIIETLYPWPAPPPSVDTFAINNGAATTNSLGVTLNNTSTGTPTDYMASESPTFTGAVWLPYSTAPAFLLSAGNGTKTVYFKVRDAALQQSAVVSDTIVVNIPVPPPAVITFAINNGAAITNSLGVTLNNTSTGTATDYMASESPTFTGAVWLPYSTAPAFLLSAGNGTKTVYFKVRDAALQESPVLSDTIVVNIPVAPPAVITFAINNGAAITNSLGVTLNNTSTGIATEYMASESPTFTGAVWLPYSTAPAFLLSAGNGTKTVYFKVRDAALQQSAVVSDTIFANILVPPPAVITFAINNGATTTASLSVTLNNTSTGIPTEYMASESPTFTGAVWLPYSTAPAFTLLPGNGTKTVYFKVTDAALQESPVVSDTIVLNAPTPGGIDDYVTLGAIGADVQFTFLIESGSSIVVTSNIQYNGLGQRVSFCQQYTWAATGNVYDICVSGIVYNSLGQVTSYHASVIATIGGNPFSGTLHYPGP